MPSASRVLLRKGQADALMLPSTHAAHVQRKAGTVHLWPRTAQLKDCQAWTIDSTHGGERPMSVC